MSKRTKQKSNEPHSLKHLNTQTKSKWSYLKFKNGHLIHKYVTS